MQYIVLKIFNYFEKYFLYYLILHLLLLKEKECKAQIISFIAPLLKERGWGEVEWVSKTKLFYLTNYA
jgi:hypothetical protein